MLKISKIAVPGVAEPYDIGTLSIPFGQVDSTSTDTAYTAQIEGITSLYDGVCVYLKNGVITSNKNGFTLNINGLGAKPVYDTLAAATRSGTVFNVDYTMLFVYNSSRVSGGCWDIFYGYNSDTTDLEEALTPLTGTTEMLTPTQVYDAIKSGKSVVLQHTHSLLGLFTFASFNIFEREKTVVSTSIAKNGGTYLVGSLAGFAGSNEWVFNITEMAKADDIPVAVSEALAQAKASGEFDGADGLTPTIGDNGNWYLGNTDTGMPSRGEKGDKGDKGDIGETGATGAAGAAGKSAYAYAQDGGYTGTEAEFAEKLAQEMPSALPNPNALMFTGAVTGSYDGSEPLTVEIPSEGGNKGWTLLYDGTITIEEAVKTVTVSLLAPCEGMVDFIGHVSWTDNANTESGIDDISIGVGKANMGYGRIGKASDAGSSIFQATVTSSRTYFGVANVNLKLEFNKANMMYGFSKNINNANYETATIDFFAKTYAGTITLQLYGR